MLCNQPVRTPRTRVVKLNQPSDSLDGSQRVVGQEADGRDSAAVGRDCSDKRRLSPVPSQVPTSTAPNADLRQKNSSRPMADRIVGYSQPQSGLIAQHAGYPIST
eukprot:m.756743 g.756743  ORF g.756743 m.756743 type:complete len:105 (-) comp59018_c0_seq47:1248-1562(-)